MRTVSAAIDIAAAPAHVWAILADLAAYPQWNPLFPQASGELAVGARITLRAVQPSGRAMTIRARVRAADPAAGLRWAAGLPGIISGEHSFTLAAGGGGTHLVQSETFRGVLVPFSRRTLTAVQASYAELNLALKARAESR